MSEKIHREIYDVRKMLSALESITFLLSDINNILREIGEYQDRLDVIVNDLKERVKIIKRSLGKK